MKSYKQNTAGRSDTGKQSHKPRSSGQGRVNENPFGRGQPMHYERTELDADRLDLSSGRNQNAKPATN